MSKITSPEYWNDRYLENNTPWDIGYASPPITEYVRNKVDKSARILVPGAGNAHEAVWLWNEGYKNTWVVDIAERPLQLLKEKEALAPDEQLLHANFFDLKDQFDIIIEQTFFCALPPSWRQKYSQKMGELLKPGGKLFGVLFDFPLTEEGPPFGGSLQEYQDLFSPSFEILKMEPCINSIKPRSGRELFVEFKPKSPGK